jgi:hypothetical protein
MEAFILYCGWREEEEYKEALLVQCVYLSFEAYLYRRSIQAGLFDW